MREGRRSYVVVTFDSNEFVSREAVGEEVSEKVGVVSSKKPVPLESMEYEQPVPGQSGIGRSLDEYNRTSPPAVPTPSKEASVRMDREPLSVHNPIWKHEVFL